MRKEIKRNYILKQPILGIFVGILLGQGSMLIQGNKPYLAVVYRQKKEGIQLISLLKSILSSFIDESKELGLKGHHGMLDKTHCFMTIKHICFKLLFDMFFFIKADQIVVSKKYKVKVSVDKSRYFSVGDYKKTVYSLKKKVPDNLYEYFDANVLAYWFMDELSCYYDDGLGLRGYLLDTSSFSEINSINKLVECLEVNLCLDSKVLSSKLKGINYILVKNIKDFNYKVYPYLLPEFYKKLYINNYSYENYVSFHKCVYKATSMNMTQFNLVIATILSGNTKLKSKNNKYYL